MQFLFILKAYYYFIRFYLIFLLSSLFIQSTLPYSSSTYDSNNYANILSRLELIMDRDRDGTWMIAPIIPNRQILPDISTIAF
jgi:hypothetical protein